MPLSCYAEFGRFRSNGASVRTKIHMNLPQILMNRSGIFDFSDDGPGMCLPYTDIHSVDDLKQRLIQLGKESFPARQVNSVKDTV